MCPVAVEHSYGSTTVPSAPERIAVVGLTEQDIVLALGQVPIAITEWYGDQPSAVWPWAQERLGGAEPTVLSVADGFQLEKIAGLKPDLIIGTNSGMTKADYEKFSALAPTIPGVKGGTEYLSPWDEQTELVAAAMGKAEEGRQLVKDVQDAYTKAAAEHPEFGGKVATYLGFTINPRLKEIKTPRASRSGSPPSASTSPTPTSWSSPRRRPPTSASSRRSRRSASSAR